MGLVVYLTGLMLSSFFAHTIVFGLQTILGVFIIVLLFYLLKIEEFYFVKSHAHLWFNNIKDKVLRGEKA